MASLLRSYEKFVRTHPGTISMFEEAARALTIFIPNRFSTEELRGEALFTAVNLLSLYHDRILDRHRASAAVCELKSSPETSGTRFLKNILTFLRNTQMLIEMAAIRAYSRPPAAPAAGASSEDGGPSSSNGAMPHSQQTWAVVGLVELVKAFCALLLLRNNRYRMTVNQSPQEVLALHEARQMKAREQKFEEEQREENSLSSMRELQSMYAAHGRGFVRTVAPGTEHNNATGPPVGAADPSFTGHGYFSVFTNPSRWRPPASRDTSTRASAVNITSERPNTLQIMAELLHIARPVVYVAARLLCRGNNNSWTPFIVSVLVDAASRLCLHAGTAGLSRLNPQQKEEASRRAFLWAYYLLRPPLFDLVARGPLTAVGSLLARVPLVGVVFANILELLLRLPEFYFYTSGT